MEDFVVVGIVERIALGAVHAAPRTAWQRLTVGAKTRLIDVTQRHHRIGLAVLEPGLPERVGRVVGLGGKVALGRGMGALSTQAGKLPVLGSALPFCTAVMACILPCAEAASASPLESTVAALASERGASFPVYSSRQVSALSSRWSTSSPRLEANDSLVVTSAMSSSSSTLALALVLSVNDDATEDELCASGMLGARESEAIQLASWEMDCSNLLDSASSFLASLRSMLRWKARSPWVGMAAALRVSGWSADWRRSRYAGSSVLGSGMAGVEAVAAGSGVDAAESTDLLRDPEPGLEPDPDGFDDGIVAVLLPLMGREEQRGQDGGAKTSRVATKQESCCLSAKKFSLFRRCFHLFSSIPAVEEGE